MKASRGSVQTVVHVGSDAGRIRDAAAEATTISGPESVVSVDDVTADRSVPDPDDVGLIVCELPRNADADRLVESREAYPDVPSLAVLPDDVAVDEALAAGATDVLVRRDGVEATALFARRMDTVATTPMDPSPGADSTERLLDAIDDSFYILDADGNLEQWNDRFRDITGYDDDELARMHALDLFAGPDADRVADAIETVLETGSATVEAELVSKDGTTIPIEYTGALVTGTDGAPRGIVGIGREVTDRRDRQERLLRLRQAVETVVDSAPLTLFEVDPDGVVETVRGETLAECLERPVADGRSVEAVLADQPRLRRHVEAALDGESSHGLVDVTDATLEAWLQPLLDETGTVTRVIGLTLDVTEREERAEMLDQIQANAGEVIWLSAPGKESMDFISDSYEDVWGHPPETLDEDATSFVEAIHPEDRERVETALARQRKAPDEYDETYRVVRPDGEVRWVHDQSAGVYEDGELTRIVGIATDITVRKRREQELGLKNRAIETAPIGIAIHDVTGLASPMTYVNAEFEAITGRDRDSLVGEGLAVLGGADTSEERLQTVASALDTGEHRAATAVLYRADGTPFWGRVGVAPVVGADGEVTHAVSFLEDVTESKEHEQEIERHLAEFGEVLAEDLGVPLREAEQHLEAAIDDDGSREDLRRAERSVEAVVSLVDDLATVHSFSVEPRRVSESIRESTPMPTGRDE